VIAIPGKGIPENNSVFLGTPAKNWLMTFKEYPPSQVLGDWSLSTIEEQIKEMIPTSE